MEGADTPWARDASRTRGGAPTSPCLADFSGAPRCTGCRPERRQGIDDVVACIGNELKFLDDLSTCLADLLPSWADLSLSRADLSAYLADLSRYVADLAGYLADLAGYLADLAGYLADLAGGFADAAGGLGDAVREVDRPLGMLRGRNGRARRGSPRGRSTSRRGSIDLLGCFPGGARQIAQAIGFVGQSRAGKNFLQKIV